MTSPTEDRLRRAVDEMLTICWNEDIPLLEAMEAAVNDWVALSVAEFCDFPNSIATHCDGQPLSALFLAVGVAAKSYPGFTVEHALADAVSGWAAESRQLSAVSR